MVHRRDRHPRTPGRAAILFALAPLRSVPQAGSQFRGRSKLFMKYPGLGLTWSFLGMERRG
jgi:hypothetical protein